MIVMKPSFIWLNHFFRFGKRTCDSAPKEEIWFSQFSLNMSLFQPRITDLLPAEVLVTHRMCSFCCCLYFWMRISLLAYKKGERCLFLLAFALLKNIGSYLLIKAHIALARVIQLTDRRFLFHKICLLIKPLTWQNSLFILQLLPSKKGFDGLQRELLLLLFKKDKGIGAKKTQKGRTKTETYKQTLLISKNYYMRAAHLILSFQSQGKDETISFMFPSTCQLNNQWESLKRCQ